MSAMQWRGLHDLSHGELCALVSTIRDHVEVADERAPAARLASPLRRTIARYLVAPTSGYREGKVRCDGCGRDLDGSLCCRHRRAEIERALCEEKTELAATCPDRDRCGPAQAGRQHGGRELACLCRPASPSGADDPREDPLWPS